MTAQTDNKVEIELELDEDLIEALRKLGPNWEERVNDVMRGWLMHAGLL